MHILTVSFPGRTYIALGPLVLYRFLQQSLTIWARAPGTVTYPIKWLDEVAAFKTKTRNFMQDKHLNWLAKNELRGPEPPGRQYYC